MTNATAKVCHFRNVVSGKNKVYINEVIDPNAHLWEPQGGHNTLAGFIQGGFVIWLECWLRKI